MPVSLRKPTGRIGAVAEGVDLTAPPDDRTLTAPRDALGEHKALALDNAVSDTAVSDNARLGHSGRRSGQLAGDASHYTGFLAVAA
ncbi:hypothetical protein [Streptomyces sp. NPDC002599]|uniref:hypothetical protein n=1 Tax=Streptomyces sp. NPDC002599 TaxID=3154421 RepID=UPI003325E611